MATNDARVVETLVSDHLYLVQHIVHELASRYPRHVDRQDLWSAGAMGLVEAARRYDASGGVPFANYARTRIRGAIVDSTRQRDWATRGVRSGNRELNDAAVRFEQDNHRAPTNADLAAVLGVDESEVERRRAAAHRSTVLHLDQPLNDADGDASTLGDSLPYDGDHGSPEGTLEMRELLGAVRTAVKFLDPVQRDIVERFYLQGELLRDIAEEMGVTEARVSQLASEAVHALRAYLAHAEYDAPAVPERAAGKRKRAAFVAEVSTYTTWRDRIDAADAVATAGAARAV